MRYPLPFATVWSPRGRAPSIGSTFGYVVTAKPVSSMTEIRDLLSFKRPRVANLLSRGAELRYRREFGVSLWEWRTIALLGRSDEPMSLGHLAKAASIDKGQMSRVVAGLAKRRIVLREAHPGDGRGVQLTLSKLGRRIYQGLIRAAAERDRMGRNCLSQREVKVFEQAVSKIASEAGGRIPVEKGVQCTGASPRCCGTGIQWS